jgi:hypothetical protein
MAPAVLFLQIAPSVNLITGFHHEKVTGILYLALNEDCGTMYLF